MQIDNPKEILNLKTVKGQNPPTKKISHAEKKVQARGSKIKTKCVKMDNPRPKRDKKNNPEPKITNDNEEMFQNINHPVLEPQMPLTNMPKVTATQETSQRAAIITTPTNRKKVTTIFVKNKVEAKKVNNKQKRDIHMSKERWSPRR